jgi:hypothetical protein
MKTEKTITVYTCDACGKEVETPAIDFVRGSVENINYISQIRIGNYGCSDYIMKDFCWECEQKIYNFLEKEFGFTSRNLDRVKD